MPATPSGRRRSLTFGAVAALGATLLLLAAFELLLRSLGMEPLEYVPADVRSSRWWTRPPAPGETWRYSGWLPLAVREFEVDVRFNALGWRERDYAFQKPDGVYRILMLGDSYLEGKEVPFDATFHELLEEKLTTQAPPPVEVIALGRGGSGTRDQLLSLRDVGLRFEPDLVVLCFFGGNDVLENSPALSEARRAWLSEVYEPHVVAPRARIHQRLLWAPGSVLNHFVLARVLEAYTANAHLFHTGLGRDDLVDPALAVYEKGDYDARWRAAWQTTRALVTKTRDVAASHGAELMVVLVHSFQAAGLQPDEAAGGPDGRYDLRRPARLMQEHCASLAVECVDLGPPLDAHLEATGERYTWQYDAHWNATGHRIAADVLLEAVTPRIRPH